MYNRGLKSLAKASSSLVRYTTLCVSLALHLIFLEFLFAEGDVSLSGLIVELLAAPLTLGPIIVLLGHSRSSITGPGTFGVVICSGCTHRRSEHLRLGLPFGSLAASTNRLAISSFPLGRLLLAGSALRLIVI